MKQQNNLPTQLSIEYVPDLTMEEYNLRPKFGIDINTLGTLLPTLKPLAELVRNNPLNAGRSGLYRVYTQGKPMFHFKNGPGFLGSLKTANGAVGGGQARMFKCPIDPGTLSIGMVLLSLELKLDAIQEAQKDIQAFLELKEKVRVKANIDALLDILTNYKYNYENLQFRNNNHILVESIKKEANESILLFDTLLLKRTNKNGTFKLDQKTEDYIKDSADKLNDYQLSLYAYTLSSLLEIILLQNFDHKFIEAILAKINLFQGRYSDTLAIVKKKVELDSSKSIQTSIVMGVSKMNMVLGKALTKSPLSGKTKIEKNLFETGDRLQKSSEDKAIAKGNTLSDTRKDLLSPLTDNIRAIDLIYNGSPSLVLDEKKAYLLV